MFTKYAVATEHFAERHFIKNFKKKYKTAWDITWRAMIEEFKRTDALFNTSIVETIIDVDNIKIVKTEFRIAGSKKSRKSSGNRCIVAVHRDIRMVYVLLVYHKNDLGGSNETARWKQIIKENYDQYRDLF
ncbi:hypothetical protein KKC65_01365 [Patescibacteria group bacterium]|nr:hypothetical protein [Patescibacteria group bacterium]